MKGKCRLAGKPVATAALKSARGTPDAGCIRRRSVHARDDEVRAAARDLGLAYVLRKPFDLEVLIALVAQVAGH